jgi:hypothetical protein
MTPILAVAAAALALLAASIWESRRTHAKLIARLRAEWGHPKSRVPDEPAGIYDNAVRRDGGKSLDATTWGSSGISYPKRQTPLAG